MTPFASIQSDAVLVDDVGSSVRADADLVMLRGLEILREWLAEPQIVDMLDEVGAFKAADGARGQQD